MKMSLSWSWSWLVVVVVLLCLKKVNSWIYERKLGAKRYSLPPGDLGWPFIGNMWSFLRAFKTSNPDSFVDSLVTRYGDTGLYKAFMFGQPSVILTTPETNKRVLMDEETFQPGWPTSAKKLIGEKSFVSTDIEYHKRLRRLTAAPINGYEALSLYLGYIEDCVITSLDKWSKMGQIEFLNQLRKLTFRVITHIFIGSESEHVMEALGREYAALNYGIRAMAINIPGFAFHKSLKSRKKIVAIFQSVVDQRRNLRKDCTWTKDEDMMDALLSSEDEKGRKLDDEEIIDLLIMYLNAGHESSAHMIMWSVVYLQQHPEVLQKAKEEQERILRKRPATQKGMTMKEVREMEYLSKVIDETLRIITFSLTVFREATKDVYVNGFLIPKGWKVLAWFRNVHFDPRIYPNPRKYDPSRWDDFTPKAGSFLPFGAGSRLCPGNDLAKLEISVFLHHFLLNYELERLNPGSGVMFLPHTRPEDNCLAKVIKKSPSSYVK